MRGWVNPELKTDVFSESIAGQPLSDFGAWFKVWEGPHRLDAGNHVEMCHPEVTNSDGALF